MQACPGGLGLHLGEQQGGNGVRVLVRTRLCIIIRTELCSMISHRTMYGFFAVAFNGILMLVTEFCFVVPPIGIATASQYPCPYHVSPHTYVSPGQSLSYPPPALARFPIVIPHKCVSPSHTLTSPLASPRTPPTPPLDRFPIAIP